MRQLIVLICLICANLTYAQQVTLSGKVEDAYTGKGLQGVMVTIRPKGGNRILKFSKTQEDGSYKINLNALPEGNNVLHFSMMGICYESYPLIKGYYPILCTPDGAGYKAEGCCGEGS